MSQAAIPLPTDLTLPNASSVEDGMPTSDAAPQENTAGQLQTGVLEHTRTGVVSVKPNSLDKPAVVPGI